MTEAEFALLQEAKRIADALDTISGCLAKLSGLFSLAPAMDIDDLKKELVAEVRKAVSQGHSAVQVNPVPSKRWFETIDVAKELGVKPATIRGRCSAGLIAAEKWGKEWKIPAAEMERLKRDGLPPLPKPAETRVACPA
jgi:hypothetical protein